MKKIPQEQIDRRYDTLSDNLKEALFSEESANLLWNLGDTFHLTDDQKYDLASIGGYIILGFISAADLEREIAALGVKNEIAESLAKEINRKIFSPIQNELNEVYSPVSDKESVAVNDNPVDFGSKSEQIAISSAPSSEVAKTVNLNEIGEAPAIIHEEKKVNAIKQSKPSFSGIFGLFRRDEKIPPMPEKPVEAEVSLFNKTKTSEIGETEKPKMKIVHYSDFKNSFLNQTSGQPAEMNAQEKIAQQINNPLPQTPQSAVQPSVKISEQSELKNANFEQPVILEDLPLKPKENSSINFYQAAPKVVELNKIDKPELPDIIGENKLESVLPQKQIIGEQPAKTVNFYQPLPKKEVEKENNTVTLNKPAELPEPREEVKLEDIPVKEDIVDLRMLEK